VKCPTVEGSRPFRASAHTAGWPKREVTEVVGEKLQTVFRRAEITGWNRKKSIRAARKSVVHHARGASKQTGTDKRKFVSRGISGS